MAELDEDTITSMQPGQIIVPGGAAVPPPPPAAPVAPAAPTPPAPEPVIEAPLPVAAPEPIQAETDSIAADESGIAWTASEFVAHEKTANWYMSLAAVAVILSALIFFVTHDLVGPIVVVVAAIIMGIYASHQPRQLVYRLDDMGITIGHRQFPYEMFRSFSIVPEGAFSSIVLMPLKRFSPLITIYFAPEDEDVIADVLSERLPFAEFRYDAIDRLMRRIRF